MAALIIAGSVVIARATLLETLREPFGPGSKLYSRGAGPAVGLALDLICCVPAILVLLERAISGSVCRQRSWACILGGLLCLWMAASVFWADDAFAAAISTAHWIAAMVLLWAASQIVTTWSRLRLIAAISHGLLFLFLAQAVLWRYVEMPLTLANFEEHKADILKGLGWEPNSFSARQFENKLKNAEILGFSGSANTFAAELVLLMGISAGLAIQRMVDKERLWAAAIAGVIPVTFWILFLTQSKAAFVTPLLIAGVLLAIWKSPAQRRPALGYAIGVTLVVGGILLVIAYGLVSHGLPTASLNFRWRYWTAAWRMFLGRPILGVGWDNFGRHYLAYRLAAAAEEIQDPHNFLLRFLTELGIVGALLVIAWQARLWWDMTRTHQPGEDGENLGGLGLIAVIAAAGILLSFICGEGFLQPLEWMTRLLYLCLLLLGASAAGMRSLKDQQLDDRPSPWVLAAILASVGAFLIHNLIEFSLFETGPMMLFAILAGSALGMRSQSQAASVKPIAWLKLSGAGIAWLAAAAGFVAPVALAESAAHDGDDAIQTQRYGDAADDYLQASQYCGGFNADYLYRAAQAMDYEPVPDRAQIQNLLQQAIARNPSSVGYHLFLARFDLQLNDADGAVEHFSKALALNPNEVSIHLDFGDALMHLRRAAEAAEQYELALKYNDLLPAEEPKRINDGLIRGRLATAFLVMGKRDQALEQSNRALADDAALTADDPRRLTADEVTSLREIAARSH